MEKNVPHKFLKGHRDNHLRKLSRRKKKAKTKVRIIKNIEIGMQKQFKVDNIKAHNDYITSIFTPDSEEKISKKT